MSGEMDKIAGRAKQAAGDLTGDDELEQDGERQELAGDLKDKVGEVKEGIDDKIDAVRDKIDQNT